MLYNRIFSIRFDPSSLYDLRTPIGLASCHDKTLDSRPLPASDHLPPLCRNDSEELSNSGLYSSGECEESDSNSSRGGLDTPLSGRLKRETALGPRDDNDNDPGYLLTDSPPLISRRTR